jgi:hypothetical protein
MVSFLPAEIASRHSLVLDQRRLLSDLVDIVWLLLLLQLRLSEILLQLLRTDV